MKDIIKEQTMNGGLIGSKIHVSGTSTFVVLMKRVTLMQLKNWRKQFLSIILKQQINQDQVAASFVTFINTQLKESIVYSKDVREKEFIPLKTTTINHLKSAKKKNTPKRGIEPRSSA